MAKTPDKSSAKPKRAPMLKAAPNTIEGTEKPAKKIKAAAPKGTAAKPKKASKAKPVPTATPSSGIADFAKGAADAVSKLASDILADRIVPTIDQIKAVAAHALGRESVSKSKPKSKAAKKK